MAARSAESIPSPRESSPDSAASRGAPSAADSGTAQSGKTESGKSLQPLSWLKSTVASLDGHVSEIRKGAAAAAEELAGTVQKGMNASAAHFVEERFDVVFIERALGLKVDFSRAAVVFELTAGGQGERLQVLVDDKIVAINGKDLDPYDPADNAAFIQDTQTRMRHMGRPCTLTFARMNEVPPTEEASSTEFMEGLKKLQKKIPGTFAADKEVPSAELLAEVEAATALARRFELEAKEAQEEARQQAGDAIAAVEEAAQLRADLAELQLTKVWKAEEIQRSAADAEAAQSVAAEIREQLADSQREVERLLEEQALAEERLATRQRSAAEEAAEVQRLRERLRDAEAVAEQQEQSRRIAEEMRCSAERRLEETYREIGDMREREAQLRASDASALAALREAREAAELRQVQLMEELSVAAAKIASEGRRFADQASELEAARAEVPRLAAAERLVPELRREVDRLRKEVALFESAAGRGGDRALADAEARIGELKSEVDDLRADLRHQDPATHSAMQDPDWEKVPSKPPATPPPQILGLPESPASAAAVAEGDGDVSCDGGRSAGSKQRRERVLEVKVAELEHQNAALTRQLNSRPIVFQFASSPEDEDDPDDPEHGAEDDDRLSMPDAERMVLAPSAPSRAPAAGGLAGGFAAGGPVGGGQPHAFAELRVGRAALIAGGLVWLRRRSWRAFVTCRKQRQAQSMERLLRNFSRRMLQSPVLLWLFYVHVLVLWFLEAWRQAVSSSVVADPVDRLNAQMGR